MMTAAVNTPTMPMNVGHTRSSAASAQPERASIAPMVRFAERIVPFTRPNRTSGVTTWRKLISFAFSTPPAKPDKTKAVKITITAAAGE